MVLRRLGSGFLIAGLLALLCPALASASTPVGGVLGSDTTWTASGSPYLVNTTVQIPDGITLRIEPGVVVKASPGIGDVFLVHGTLRALGTADSMISFEGAGDVNFFSPKSSPATMLVHVEHAEISNGRSLWPATGHQQYGRLILRHSNVSNMTSYSYLWYPQDDVYVEYNTFVNAQGFSIGTGSGMAGSEDVQVYVRWNRFVSLSDAYSVYPAWIWNWASYGSSRTLVNFNVFESIPAGKYALYLPSGYDSAAINGTNNYWGTTDESYIRSRIFDENDDITTAGVIPFQPPLSSAPAEVPASPPTTLVITKSGNGTGTVVSDPHGIDCGSSCRADFPMGSSVTLTAEPTQGSEFVGWSGACAGSGTCSVSLSEDRSVTAAFRLQELAHSRSISLNLNRHLVARGTVATPGAPSCAAGVALVIQSNAGNGWKQARATTSSANGGFRVRLQDKPARYRAVAPAFDLDAQNTCQDARSEIVRHRH